MRKIVQLAVLSTTVATSLTSFAGIDVIYGDDNRKEVYESSAVEQKLALSTATMVNKDLIVSNTLVPGTVSLKQTSLKSWMEAALKSEAAETANQSSAPNPTVIEEDLDGGVSEGPKTPHKLLSAILKGTSAPDLEITFCAEERFVNQPNPGSCSGFLIAPDLIVTAGHCLAIEKSCETYKWVFDFKLDKDTQTAGTKIPQENVYSCKQFVSGGLNNAFGFDFGVIQLDRDVVGREPLKIRTEGKIADEANLLLIGSPSGLPLKVASGAKIRANAHPNFFTANTDSYQGNSGSAVFDAETGVVEGILVRGEEDFVPNFKEMCIESNKCKDDECRGEDISRLTSIPEVALNKAFRQVAVDGNLALVKQITALKTWVDFYLADKVTVLMEAVAAGQSEVVEALLAAGANAKLKDVSGNSTLHYAIKAEGEKALELINKLIAAQVDINTLNLRGESVLFDAVRSGDVELVKSLVELGADITLVSKEGKGILQVSKDKAMTKLIKKADKARKKAIKKEMRESIKEIRQQAKEEMRKMQ